jgi:RNA-directed DNA polymerase
VLDLDTQAYFDSIDWELMLKAVRQHTDCRWVLLYVERWLKAPVQMEDGSIVLRTAGTPQGGVISPVWPKYWNCGRTRTSQGDRACRSARVWDDR